MDDQSRQNLKDAFAHDMAEHQRVTGQEPTPAANERIAVPFFEELEQKLEERRRQPAPEIKADPRGELDQGALRDECRRRGREGAADALSIQRMPDKAPIAVASDPADLERGLRMLRRLHLLLDKRERGILGAPSWRERALAVAALKLLQVDRRRVAFELAALCEASVPSFGPWDVPEGEGRPLHFT
jgi:hypothetical protein